ncbi:C40 family peptidase [Lactobacillus sp. LL6]|uniref:C40 family peptidase n=1 Tax=Lactobacillus sp. LL6 TaxID=2596827 RepID=UPI0011872A99|nr:C40 family peptidase [Lactobacillus sp. LL6]TSO25720.1 hydrolase [Lactobacillus sp. LL6]
MTQHKLFKIGAAAALTLTGISTVSSFKTVSASSFVALKRVKIHYLPGKGVRIWTSYNNGQFMGFRAKDGTVWNVAKTALDKQGNLWYKVGTREWIPARYTIDVENDVAKHPKKKTAVKTEVKKVNAQKTPQIFSKNEKNTVTIKKADSAKNTNSVIKKTIDKVKKVNVAKKIVKAAVKNTAQSKPATQAPVANTTNRADAIVSLAKKEVGKPYVWSGASEDGFDCSGLVQYVYSHAAGVNMPRTTWDQVKVGTTVSMDQLQAGDLIYWGDVNNPYHVAIYIGNNQYVNAATPEQGVILQTLTSYYYPTVAKRVL